MKKLTPEQRDWITRQLALTLDELEVHIQIGTPIYKAFRKRITANNEPEDENQIAKRKIEEFTKATRRRYEMVEEIPLLEEFADWLQSEDKC